MEDRQRKQRKRNEDWNIRPYLAIGLTAFIVIISCILIFFLIYRYYGLTVYWNKLMGVLQPVLLGMVFAYLLNPIVKFGERHLVPFLEKHMKKERKAQKVARTISVIGAVLFVLIIIAVLLGMVIPELYTSIERLVIQLPGQVESLIAWGENYIRADSELANYVEEVLMKGLDFFENWAKTDILPQAKNMVTAVTGGFISVLRVLFNAVIGIVISVYILMGKETFIGQAKKIVYAILPAYKGNVLIETIRKGNDIFGGFISGKILDSAIIGVLCFIGLSILKMPYCLLVSVIVGVTNVVPFFGPYIGAIPCTILITLANPIQGLYFVIFILVLQQLDGNIIGPRILGESTGLSSFWVIFAILVGGGLFGFLGMVIGVPAFATIYYIIKRIISYILKRRGLPQETNDYTELVRVDPDSKHLDYK